MDLELLEKEMLSKLENIEDLQNLQQFKVEYLGKKGKITQILRSLGSLPKEERPVIGKKINELKEKILKLLETKEKELYEKEKERKKKELWIDVTIPGAKRKIGHTHPVLKTLHEIERIFVSMGFDVVEGPEVETTWYNFDALNTPEWHPARDEHDSFYFSKELLLRTHTSPVQIRTMLKRKPPLAIISPGRVCRRDYDATHLPMFFQVEGLYVDKNVNVGHLKYILGTFAERIFGKDAKIRLKQSFFPFTEPSFEVDVYFPGYGWLEILGAGMVDPAVFESVGYDPEEWTGFAFGMGVERITMLKYGITDIREFIRNDINFLSKY